MGGGPPNFPEQSPDLEQLERDLVAARHEIVAVRQSQQLERQELERRLDDGERRLAALQADVRAISSEGAGETASPDQPDLGELQRDVDSMRRQVPALQQSQERNLGQVERRLAEGEQRVSTLQAEVRAAPTATQDAVGRYEVLALERELGRLAQRQGQAEQRVVRLRDEQEGQRVAVDQRLADESRRVLELEARLQSTAAAQADISHLQRAAEQHLRHVLDRLAGVEGRFPKNRLIHTLDRHVHRYGGGHTHAGGAGGDHDVLDAADAHTDVATYVKARGSLIVCNATPAWDGLAIGAAARLLQSNGTDPSWVAMSGQATIAAGGAVTVAASHSGSAHHAENHAARHAAADSIAGQNFTITGNWFASGVTGAIKVQTAAGVPVHVEDEGVLYWDTAGHKLYSSKAGGAWEAVGPAAAAGAVMADGSVPLTGNWAPGVHQIGNYDFSVLAAAAAITDSDFALMVVADIAIIYFDTADTDYFGYIRADDKFTWVIGGAERMGLDSSGNLTVAGTVDGVDIATRDVRASAAEINTSTDTVKVMAAGQFSDSNYGIRYVAVEVVAPATSLVTGDNQAFFHIPPGLNGMDLMYVHAEVITASVGAAVSIQFAKNGSTDMLSTALTIDATETGSDTAATPAVIKNDGSEAVATNDTIEIDIDAVGSTAAKGLCVTMGFRIP